MLELDLQGLASSAARRAKKPWPEGTWGHALTQGRRSARVRKTALRAWASRFHVSSRGSRSRLVDRLLVHWCTTRVQSLVRGWLTRRWWRRSNAGQWRACVNAEDPVTTEPWRSVPWARQVCVFDAGHWFGFDACTAQRLDRNPYTRTPWSTEWIASWPRWVPPSVRAIDVAIAPKPPTTTAHRSIGNIDGDEAWATWTRVCACPPWTDLVRPSSLASWWARVRPAQWADALQHAWFQRRLPRAKRRRLASSTWALASTNGVVGAAAAWTRPELSPSDRCVGAELVLRAFAHFHPDAREIVRRGIIVREEMRVLAQLAQLRPT